MVQFTGNQVTRITTGQIELQIPSTQTASVTLDPQYLIPDTPLDDIFVSRAEWGAALGLSLTFVADSAWTGIIVHHTAGQHQFVDAAARAAHMRTLQASDDHVTSIQFPNPFLPGGSGVIVVPTAPSGEVPYSFVIFEDGSVYEGRGWNVQAASTLGSTHMAFAFAGNFQGVHELTNAQKDSFAILRAEFLNRSPQAERITYHQVGAIEAGTDPTICPGTDTIAFLGVFDPTIINAPREGTVITSGNGNSNVR